MLRKLCTWIHEQALYYATHINTLALPLDGGKIRPVDGRNKFVVDLPPGSLIYVDGQPIRTQTPERMAFDVAAYGSCPMVDQWVSTRVMRRWKPSW